MQIRLSKKVSDYMSLLWIDWSSWVNKWIEGIIDWLQTANSVEQEEINMWQKIDLILSILQSKQEVNRMEEAIKDLKEEITPKTILTMSEQQRFYYDQALSNYKRIFDDTWWRGTDDKMVTSCMVFKTHSDLDIPLRKELAQYVIDGGVDYTLYLPESMLP